MALICTIRFKGCTLQTFGKSACPHCLELRQKHTTLRDSKLKILREMGLGHLHNPKSHSWTRGDKPSAVVHAVEQIVNGSWNLGTRQILVTVFDSLPTPRRGQSRGEGNTARSIVSNPAERAAVREQAVKAILSEKWPSPEFEIIDNTAGAGADFIIKEIVTGEVVAKADAKPSPTITRRQLLESRKANVPYWLVGTTFKLQVTKDVKLVPTQYKVYVA